jgi:NADPH-dependent glutamate synthase beta subunit-like oxidoreductase
MERDEMANAWPAYPRIFRTDYGQDEVKQRDGKDPRKYAVMTKEFIDDGAGNVKAIKIVSLKVPSSYPPSVARRPFARIPPSVLRLSLLTLCSEM